MDEEMLRIKYRNLLNKLYVLKNKYRKLDDAFDQLKQAVNNNIAVDKRSPVNDDFSFIDNSINSLNYNLSNDIIPIVRSRS